MWGRPIFMRARSALLFVVTIGVGTLVASGLAVLAILLLLLAALFFVAIRLRFLFVRLVGGISHFPSPFVGGVMLPTSNQPAAPPRCSALPRAFVGAWRFCDGRDIVAVSHVSIIGPVNH